MHRHRRRTLERQPDLFLAPPLGAAGSPGWSGLPDSTQQALAALIVRLLITHAAGLAPGSEGDADER
jgi:hypothetical protein